MKSPTFQHYNCHLQGKKLAHPEEFVHLSMLKMAVMPKHRTFHKTFYCQNDKLYFITLVMALCTFHCVLLSKNNCYLFLLFLDIRLISYIFYSHLTELHEINVH